MAKRNLIVTTLIFLSFLVVINFSCAANANLKDAFGNSLSITAGAGAGYNTTTTADSFISLVISTILSFVGVIFLILAIYGGYIWMIARGNEQEVEKAKSIIINSIIGLVIVVGAYAVSWYIVNALGNTTLRQP